MTLALSPASVAPSSPASLWTARVLAGLAVLFLAFDTSLKVFRLDPAVRAFAELGYAASSLGWLGAYELACLVLYLVPRTAPLGAVLWTGFLGGAIATHVRLENPLASHTLFPIYVAAFLWLPLWLTDTRVRGLFAARSRAA